MQSRKPFSHEIKSDKFPWDVFKSDTISFLSKDSKVLQWPSKSKFLGFMTKVNPSNGNETKIYIFPWDFCKSNKHHIFFVKILKLFQWLSKSKSHSFMTIVNTNNGNETKSNILPWGIFKSATISFHISNFTYFAYSFYIKISQWLSKLKFFIFLSTVNSNNRNQTKSDIFSWDILRSDIVFHWLQNTKICQWLLYLAIFSFIAKVNTNK